MGEHPLLREWWRGLGAVSRSIWEFVEGSLESFTDTSVPGHFRTGTELSRVTLGLVPKCLDTSVNQGCLTWL